MKLCFKGDPLVDRFLIRDSDSDITQRELDSVREWITEGKTWHIMRDHPFHGVPILGGTTLHLRYYFKPSHNDVSYDPGLWSGTNRNLTMTIALRTKFIDHGKTDTDIGHDQNLLDKYVWPLIRNDSVSHDSYWCRWFGAKPWPTRRYQMDFVGDKFPWHENREFVLATECPIPCRPQKHKDWIYC